MIQCKYPYSQDDEPTNLAEFFSTLTRHVKFSEFAELGELMFHHWRAHDSAVLVLNAESVIDIRTKVGLGEMLLAEVNDAGQLRLLSWLHIDFRRHLSQRFQTAGPGIQIEVNLNIMANPQVHARSSARKFGGKWEDYIELHAFLDSSKLHYAKATHRALLHHDFGKKLAIELFGYNWGVASGDKKVAALIDQHFSEDFTRFTPTVAKWFEGSDSSLRPQMNRKLTVDEQCAESVRHFGGDPEDYRELHEFIDSITTEVEGAWGITHSTFGLGLAEQLFGYVIGPRDVPTRTAAEKHILAEYLAIPSVQDWLSAVPIQPWMYNQAAQLSAEFQNA